MTLELTRTEADELHGALGCYLSELRVEIADTYDYRQSLKAKRTLLSGVLARLEARAEGQRSQEIGRNEPRGWSGPILSIS
jgi:hypothetical protein